MDDYYINLVEGVKGSSLITKGSIPKSEYTDEHSRKAAETLYEFLRQQPYVVISELKNILIEKDFLEDRITATSSPSDQQSSRRV